MLSFGIVFNPSILKDSFRDTKTFTDRIRGSLYGSSLGLVLGGSVGSVLGGILGIYKGDKHLKKESARVRRDFLKRLGLYEEWKRIAPYQSYIILALLAIINIYTGGALSGYMGAFIGGGGGSLGVVGSYFSFFTQALNIYATYQLLQLRGVVGFNHALDYAILSLPLAKRGEYLAGGSLRNACFAGGELHNKSGYLADPNARAFGMPEYLGGFNSLYLVNFIYENRAGGSAYNSHLAGGEEFLVANFLNAYQNKLK